MSYPLEILRLVKLHARLIKLSTPHILDPLLHLCNLSLTQGIFPSELEIAKVVPIFQAGDKMLCYTVQITDLYQSYLCYRRSIYRRVMYNRLIEFIEKFKILYPYQFGFRKHNSTYMPSRPSNLRLSQATSSFQIRIALTWWYGYLIVKLSPKNYR